MKKGVGSGVGSEAGSGSGFGSISQRYGSVLTKISRIPNTHFYDKKPLIFKSLAFLNSVN
jgi:hypothetical protein